tara:strand:+ start:367 stop:783 length:417 start_codon:yes stop_codon:yes gene_type:complete
MKITKKQLHKLIKEELEIIRLENALHEKEQDERADLINKILLAIEQFAEDPEVVSVLGSDGLTGALETIRDKILNNQDAEDTSTGLDTVMEKKENCFTKGKYKTFKGKAKCIQRTKGLSKKSADAYVAKVLRDMGEID